MKNDSKYWGLKRRKLRHDRGVAIITILSVLMLMTVLVLSFFALATNDLRGAKTNAEQLRAGTAKDIAINLAVAQIREATTRADTTWVSQPGAIRVISSRSRSSQGGAIYKLYSSRSMIAGRVDQLAADIPNDWSQRPNQFVDINRPILSPDPADPENVARAAVHFPVVDPRAYRGEGEPGSVEGFDYDDSALSGIVKRGPDYLKRLPMPVQWLYVLQDGSLGYLDNSNRFVGPVLATEENPIVSRIAFWTDDDSCKVNVNTASEGVYWDTPRVDTDEDREYAIIQPETGDFQRYPAHPAMTSLSAVLFPNEGAGENGRLDPDTATDLKKMEALWSLAPGIKTLGSNEPVAPYHLHATPDEILFTSDLRAGKRLVHPEITQEKLERARFFLSARSKAPETTYLSKPRIVMWPVAEAENRRTGFDKAFAFCGTIGGGAYFFQRGDAYSRHNEFYDRADHRNADLYNYCKKLTDEPLPGFGDSFTRKYGAGRFDDRDNILAETFDYIRGTNLYDGFNSWSYTAGGENDRTVGHGQIAPICLCGGTRDHPERWSNARMPLPKGFGRMFGLSEVSLIAILRAERISETESRGSQADIDRYGLQPGQRLIQMGLILEAFAPAQGWTSLQPKMAASFGGGSRNTNDRPPVSLSLNGVPLKWATGARRNDAADFIQSSKSRPKDWIAWGGAAGVRVFNDMLSFEPVVIDGEADDLEFSGTTQSDPLRVILYDTEATSFDVNNLVQSYQLAFPPASFAVPDWWSPGGSRSGENSLKVRMREAIQNGADRLFSPKSDVVQSLLPNHGDYRLICSKRVIEPQVFLPHPLYGKNRMAHALMDFVGRATGVQPLAGAVSEGDFLPGVNYPAHRAPDFPISTASEDWAADSRGGRGTILPAITGDFDTGVGNASDGPFINKADDGDTRGMGSTSKAPYFDLIREPRHEARSVFTPNRLIPGPGMLGSLSTGVQANVPWQTLLFRPHANHYGATGVPDHMWMDAFWMPVVQPYVISEPFASGGKLNMNYQILPFRYIKRATGLHALMKAEKFLAIPNSASASYKDGAGNQKWRHFIAIDETLKQWEEKFDRGEVFRSASEICEMYLVPEGQEWSGVSDMEKFWDVHQLTGDNVKERPYTNLYPRLTVRSNTFTVHVIAQSLSKVKGTAPDAWVDGRDRVAGEFRGSAIIERHIDPTDPDIPDFADSASKFQASLDDYYSYRIVNLKRFAP
ncbi:MAG: Verru_Chthon cassette protein A [Verrucomicrobiae bacterium]|nr:Verru_Chthon cassette protein A [Verrucomicrobiae bacterium]